MFVYDFQNKKKFLITHFLKRRTFEKTKTMALTGRLVTSLSGKFTSLSLKTTFVGSSKATIFTDQSLAATSTQLPKRPLNPFLLFAQNEMANLKAQVAPNARAIEYTKLAAEKYRVLSEAEKKVSCYFILLHFKSTFLISSTLFRH